MLYSVQRQQRRKAQLKGMISHPYFGFFALGFIMLFVLIGDMYLFEISNNLMRAFGLTMIYIMIGLGFSILLGYSGLASLGTAGFVGIGSYLIGYLSQSKGYSLGVVILISVLGAIVLGTIVGFISLRIEGMYLAIITLGLSEILKEVFLNATTITGGSDGMELREIILFGQTVPVEKNTIFAYLIPVLVGLMILTLNIMKSPTGRAMLAMKNSESAAQAMGVSLLRYRLLAFVISTVYALIGGVAYMAYIAHSDPTVWGLSFSLNLLAAVIVGGSQSILGIVLGTFMIFGLNLAVFQQIPFFQNNPAITLVFNGILIIVVVMFYPGGLYRLVMNLKFQLTRFFNKLNLKWNEYRYGKDDK